MECHSKPESIIKVENINFTWPTKTNTTLEIEKFQVSKGEQVFVMGPSGSGKTTLLSILAGIIKPQTGSVSILGQNLSLLRGAACDEFRANHIGFIFQMFNLIPYLSVVENVTLPCRFSRIRQDGALQHSSTIKDEALRLLGHLNLKSTLLLNTPVAQLSVGQQQRVAAARALIGSPELLIADEPTSSLDSDQRKAFIQLLFEECKVAGTTLVFVSHDTSLSCMFDHTINLQELNRATKEEE